MADYYSILKKTISGLPTNTARNREVVYGKARQAIDRQLRALEPTPPESAIQRQMQTLEEAITTIEQEYADAPQPAVPAAPEPAAPPTAQAANAPAPIPASPVAPQPAAPTPPRSAPVPPASTPATPTPPPPPPVSRPVEPPMAPSISATRTDPSISPPGSAPQPAYDTTLDELDEAPPPTGRQRVSALGREKRRSSRVAATIITIVVLAVIAGGGYLLWQNREPLMAALNPGGGAGQETMGQTSGDQEAGNDDGQSAADDNGETPASSDKEDARLTNSGETVSAQPNRGVGQSQPDGTSSGNVREAGQPDTGEQAGQAAGEDTQGANGQPMQVNPVGGEDTADSAQQSQQASNAADAQSGSALPPPAIAQKAYLYEEGGSGAGARRDNAAIVWSVEQQQPSDGAPPEAVIRGEFDVPGRGLTMQMTIKRNVDEALPASHIIELKFETPPDFSGGDIDNVARFVMKSSEQARGEGLIAVPAKIDTGYFLIALNNLAQAQETNRKLLLESTWIDIPVGYTSGKRALVTLEKGALGEKAFQEAFADWDARSQASQ